MTHARARASQPRSSIKNWHDGKILSKCGESRMFSSRHGRCFKPFNRRFGGVASTRTSRVTNCGYSSQLGRAMPIKHGPRTAVVRNSWTEAPGRPGVIPTSNRRGAALASDRWADRLGAGNAAEESASGVHFPHINGHACRRQDHERHRPQQTSAKPLQRMSWRVLQVAYLLSTTPPVDKPSSLFCGEMLRSPADSRQYRSAS